MLNTRMFLFSVLAVTASSLAMADATVNVSSEQVHYDDARLVSNEAAAVLYSRLRGAAERVCGPVDSTQISKHQRYRTCVDRALARAVADVNHPVLNQYAESKRLKELRSTST